MDERSFVLLLEDDEYLERIASGEYVVIDAAMTAEQVKRLALHLLETRNPPDVVHLPGPLHRIDTPEREEPPSL